MKKHLFLAAAVISMAVALTACANGKLVISPTPTSAVAPTDTPATPTNVPPTDVPATPTEVPATPTPLPEKDLSEFDPLDFFKDAIYIGDSLMNFYQWRGNSYLHSGTFGKYNAKLWLAVNSYCVRFAIRDVSTLSEKELGMVPKYNGEARQMWDVVKELGKTRVFTFFGLNDIGVSGVDKYLEQYVEFLTKIKAASPDVKCYVLSITSMRKDKQSTTGGLTNAKIKEANEKLVNICAENGWTFVDVASKLRDENYDLLLKYSDGTNVHITTDGYVFWDEALEKLAREELRKEYYEGGTN